MWTFCKTENRPYDVVVTAILIAAAVRSLDSATVTVQSDGRWDNWAAGMDLFEKAVRPLTEDKMIALELDVEAMRPASAPPTIPKNRGDLVGWLEDARLMLNAVDKLRSGIRGHRGRPHSGL